MYKHKTNERGMYRVSDPTKFKFRQLVLSLMTFENRRKPTLVATSCHIYDVTIAFLALKRESFLVVHYLTLSFFLSKGSSVPRLSISQNSMLAAA